MGPVSGMNGAADAASVTTVGRVGRAGLRQLLGQKLVHRRAGAVHPTGAHLLIKQYITAVQIYMYDV